LKKTMTILQGKKGLIMGVANNRSIAWGIAEEARKYGAELAFTYQGEALQKRVEPLAKSVGSDIVLPCDVSDIDSVKNVFAELEKKWGKLDFLVHAIAYSNKEELRGRYVDTSKGNFLNTMDISAYSLVVVTKESEELMKKAGGGSIITLSYYGAEKVVPHYNVMGVAKAALEASVRYLSVDMGKHNIRVNAISAGPVKTLAASGIGDFRYIFKWNEYNSPLKRNIDLKDVGGAGIFLLSELGSGVTGEVLHVDAGYHVVGMKAIDAPDIALMRDEEHS
jgi:enoyl-[acyl-carrier protein] reductase I